MFASGELQRLIDSGLRGMTSNPTIFEKAIGSGSDYDEQLAHAGRRARSGQACSRRSRSATSAARAICSAACGKQTDGLDGYVSLEVSPTLAHDTQGTIDAAQRLWKAVDRPNLMIKIPGTAEGVPAIKASIAAGINVNVTLLFSVDRYEAAAQRVHRGARRARRQGRADRPHRVGRVGLRLAHRQRGRQAAAGEDRQGRAPRVAARQSRRSRTPSSPISASSSCSAATASPRSRPRARTCSVRCGRRPRRRTRPIPT